MKKIIKGAWSLTIDTLKDLGFVSVLSIMAFPLVVVGSVILTLYAKLVWGIIQWVWGLF